MALQTVQRNKLLRGKELEVTRKNRVRNRKTAVFYYVDILPRSIQCL